MIETTTVFETEDRYGSGAYTASDQRPWFADKASTSGIAPATATWTPPAGKASPPWGTATPP